MNKLITRLLTLAAALGVLAGCMHLPPIEVGDPLALNNKSASMVALNHMIFDAEPSPAELSIQGNLLNPDTDGPNFYMPLSRFIAAVQQTNEAFQGSLPQHLIPPPAAPSTIPPDLAEHVLRDYLGSQSQLPDTMTLDQMLRGRSAAMKQLEEQRRKLLEERIEQRIRMEEERVRAQENLRRLMEEALRQRAADRTTDLQLPLPFYIEGGTGGIDLPDAARYLANGFRQDIAISELELTVPDDFGATDYPDRLAVHGLSVTITAAQRNPSSNRVSTLLSFERTIVSDDESPFVFEHVAEGVYRPVSDERIFELRLNQTDTRALFDALNGGYDIYGNADVALTLAPALSSQVAVDFTLRAGTGYIRP